MSVSLSKSSRVRKEVNVRLFISFVDELLQSSFQETSHVRLFVLFVGISTVSKLLFIVVSIGVLLDLLSRHLCVLLIYKFLPRMKSSGETESKQRTHQQKFGIEPDLTVLLIILLGVGKAEVEILSDIIERVVQAIV